jgi:ferrous iron transport protein B
LKRAINTLVTHIEARFPGLPNARWVALRLLDGDERISDAVKKGELGQLATPATTLTQTAAIEVTA